MNLDIEGKALNEIYGWGLGSTTGVFSWPYSVCIGKINDRGIWIPKKTKESFGACMEFCKMKEYYGMGNCPSGLFPEISRFTEQTTCENQCIEIANEYGLTTKEQKSTDSNCTESYTEIETYPAPIWWLIPICVLYTSILCLIINQKCKMKKNI